MNLSPYAIRMIIWCITCAIGVYFVSVGRDPTSLFLISSTTCGGLGIVISDDGTLQVKPEQASTSTGFLWFLFSIVGWILVIRGGDPSNLIALVQGLQKL
jgi:hypothetical protein